MKIKIKLVFFLLLLVFANGSFTPAQSGKYRAGIEESWLMPSGTLADRWMATSGTSMYLGVQTSSRWTWGGKVEIFKFSKLNTDKHQVINNQTIDNVGYAFKVPISNVKQTLNVAGISLNAKYNVLRSQLFEANVDLGFGVYNWKYKRSACDSLAYDAVVNGVSHHYLVFGSVIENSQSDWSGGFTLGLELCVKPVDPVAITVSGNYKNIVGELWPALIYNMENVSTFQIIELRGGVRINF